MFNQIKFHLPEKAVSKETIEKARDAADRINRANAWFGLPVLVFAFYLPWKLYPITSGVIASAFAPSNPVSIVLLTVMCIFASACMVCCILAAWLQWDSFWRAAQMSVQPMDGALAEVALKILDAHPELEEWRIAVVRERTMTNGEVVALQQYASNRASELAIETAKGDKENALRRLHDQQNAALASIHGRPVAPNGE